MCEKNQKDENNYDIYMKYGFKSKSDPRSVELHNL